jgi:hypothetical protein
MNELEKMDRAEMMKKLVSKLTYDGVTPGNAPGTSIVTPADASITVTATQANTAIVRPGESVAPAKAGPPGQEENVLALLSSLLIAVNAQNSGRDVHPAGAQKSSGPEVIFQNAGVDPLSLPYKPG